MFARSSWPPGTSITAIQHPPPALLAVASALSNDAANAASLGASGICDVVLAVLDSATLVPGDSADLDVQHALHILANLCPTRQITDNTI